MTNAQRTKFLKLIRERPGIGNKRLLRECGVHLTERQFDAQLADNEDFRADYEEARGRPIEKLEDVVLGVFLDPESKHWPVAARLVMQARHPAYGDKTRLEVTGADGGPVELVEDRSASLAEVLAVLKAVGADDEPDDGSGASS